jgi:hypothetical protein
MNPGLNPGTASAPRVAAAVQTTWKTTVFTKTNDTTLQVIPELSVNLVAGKTYLIEFNPIAIGANLVGMQFDFNGGTAAVSSMGVQYPRPDGGTVTYGISTSLAAVFGANVTTAMTTCSGIIVCSASGTLVPRFAQATSDPSGSSVRAGAYLIATLLA